MIWRKKTSDSPTLDPYICCWGFGAGGAEKEHKQMHSVVTERSIQGPLMFLWSGVKFLWCLPPCRFPALFPNAVCKELCDWSRGVPKPRPFFESCAVIGRFKFKCVLIDRCWPRGRELSPLLMVMDEVECPLLWRSFGAMSRWSAGAADPLFRCGL